MGKAITFAQQKGGAGKTTILAHLAAAWRERGQSVSIIDLDPQQSLTRWAAIREDEGLALVESRDYRASADIKAARKKSDLVLIDCPGSASSLLENAIRESDLVIAPCQPSAMDVWATETIVKTARSLRTPLHIVLNRVPPRGGAVDEALEALGEARPALLAARLGNRVAFSAAMRAGRTAPELSRRTAAAAEIDALRAEIDAILAG